ncbi:MAG: alpha/beta fold hydrolase [Bacteroidales bacterium]|nr:alpha/beta fold hydrolase [Bacteroidales bacterium]
MQLFYRKIGEGNPALIILHGLYGASDNWMTIAKVWSEKFDVFAVDLRNHGQSPHSKIHTYQAMRDDVLELMDELNIKKAVIVGHSMGGKVAMRIAMDQPERINALVVVDIAPKNYTPEADDHTKKHLSIVQGMLSIPLQEFDKRETIDQWLMDYIKEPRTRQFIMKNLKRNKDNSFEWKLNIKVIADNLLGITGGFSNQNIYRNITGFPVLFIKGALSTYILPSDKERIEEIFPASEMFIAPEAGHWVHAEQGEWLSETVLKFLTNDI